MTITILTAEHEYEFESATDWSRDDSGNLYVYNGGDTSTAPPSRPRRQGGWPGRASFQAGPVTEVSDDGTVTERDPGPIQIGIVPDRIDTDYVEGGTLPGLENLSDFEVVYDPARLAEAILNGNYLPSNVFGGERTAPDYDVRERVFAALDLPDSLGTAGSSTEMAELLSQESPGDVRAALPDS